MARTGARPDDTGAARMRARQAAPLRKERGGKADSSGRSRASARGMTASGREIEVAT